MLWFLALFIFDLPFCFLLDFVKREKVTRISWSSLLLVESRYWDQEAWNPYFAFFIFLLSNLDTLNVILITNRLSCKFIIHLIVCTGFQGSEAPGRILRGHSMANHTSSFQPILNGSLLSKPSMFRKQYLKSWSKRVRADLACKMAGMARVNDVHIMFCFFQSSSFCQFLVDCRQKSRRFGPPLLIIY